MGVSVFCCFPPLPSLSQPIFLYRVSLPEIVSLAVDPANLGFPPESTTTEPVGGEG